MSAGLLMGRMLSGFVGEFLAMQGAYLVNSWLAFVAGIGVILGAAYMLWLYRRLFYGPLEKADVKAMPDLNMREYVMFVPLIGMNHAAISGSAPGGNARFVRIEWREDLTIA